MTRRWLPVAFVLLAVTSTVPATAGGSGYRFGVRGGVVSDPTDPALGVDVLIPLQPRWSLNPGADVVFTSGQDQAIVSVDVDYDLGPVGSARAWIGGGPAVIFNDPDPEAHDVQGAVGVLAGVGLPARGGALPYLEGKILLADHTRVAVVFGLRF